MSTTKEELETAPDPDEDDLDDLDDVLDKFDAKPATTTSTAAAPSASGPGRPQHEVAAEDVPELTDARNSGGAGAATSAGAGAGAGAGAAATDFEAEMQAGMANLISQLGENPDMQKQFEDMMQELMAAGAAGTDQEAAQHIRNASDAAPTSGEDVTPSATAGGGVGGGSSGSGSSTSKKDANFQDTIRKTMERMQQSGDAATAASASAGGAGAMSEDDMLAQMMKELGAGGEGGAEDFNQMLLSMMTQLTNKEILYEPMKELDDKFPDWLAKNGASVSEDERKRYEEQARLVKEIVQRFERSGYSDDNEDDREYIVERMQKMQAAGSPPPDLVGDMGAAQEALGELDSGCPQQ